VTRQEACPGGLGATLRMESDAIPAEKLGFDCAGHPAGTNYPPPSKSSAFKYDLNASIYNL
jgi:hypothetical protein